MNFEEAKLHPDKYFKSPVEVLSQIQWSDAQKIEVLIQWQNELQQEEDALAEGMPGKDEAEHLEEIGILIAQLRA